jgi:Family of unknown function (DUF6364)
MAVISVDDAAVERARQYAERHDTSIPELVNDFLSKLPLDEDAEDYMAGLGPIGRQFVGVARGAEVDEEDYHRYLLEKYSR